MPKFRFRGGEKGPGSLEAVQYLGVESVKEIIAMMETGRGILNTGIYLRLESDNGMVAKALRGDWVVKNSPKALERFFVCKEELFSRLCMPLKGEQDEEI